MSPEFVVELDLNGSTYRLRLLAITEAGLNLERTDITQASDFMHVSEKKAYTQLTDAWKVAQLIGNRLRHYGFGLIEVLNRVTGEQLWIREVEISKRKRRTTR
jgi:hypothetical protein